MSLENEFAVLKEAMLYTPVVDGVRCDLCARRCVIPNGKQGYCKVRRNIDGTLFTESYGNVVLRFVDGIEKKALYHFNPGSSVYFVWNFKL
jgi:pyruvate formate lyase activating enzyme